MHTWPFTTPMGFDQRYVVENKDRYLEGRYFYDEWDKALRARGLVKQQRELYRQWPDYKERIGAFEWRLDEDMHPDNFVGNMARDWIRSFPATEPLFLQIGFPGPHPPYDPIPRHAAPYLKKNLRIAPVHQSDLDNQPEPLKGMRIHNTEVDHDSVHFLLDPTRRVSDAAGTVGVRQDDDAHEHCRIARHRQWLDTRRRRRLYIAGGRPVPAAGEARHRYGVSELRHLAAHDGDPECRLPAGNP